MATVQRYVNTASTAGGDGTTNATSGTTRAYASLSEWEANAGGVATDDYIVDCCGGADTTVVTVDFATAMTSGTITIRGNRSDAAGFYTGDALISGAHYRLSPALGSGFFAIVLAEVNVTLDGIQVNASRATSNNAAFAVQVTNNTSTSTMVVQNCRIRNDGGIGNGLGSSSSSASNRTYQNNLIVGFPTKSLDARSALHFNPTINIYHNTLYGDGVTAGNIGINAALQSSGTGTTAAINIVGNVSCNHLGNEIATSGTVGTLTSTDNVTDDLTGQISQAVDIDTFTSPGLTTSSDFTVLDTGSRVYQAVNPTLITTDIVDYTRDGDNHDAGAFELVEESGGGGLPYGLDADPYNVSATFATATTLDHSSGGFTFTLPAETWTATMRFDEVGRDYTQTGGGAAAFTAGATFADATLTHAIQGVGYTLTADGGAVTASFGDATTVYNLSGFAGGSHRPKRPKRST